MRTEVRGWTLAAAAMLVVQAGLLAYAGYVHSPVYDETGHLPAGASWWLLRRTDLYPHNPPLVKVWAAWPVILAGAKFDWRAADAHPLSRPEFQFGRDFVRENGYRSFWLFTLARWVCIPFATLGGIVVYRWSAELFGRMAGLGSLALWCFGPNVLAAGQMIVPDCAAAALMIWSAYTFRRWLLGPSWRRAIVAGVTLGLANLAKFTAVILFPMLGVIGVAAIACRFISPRRHGGAERNEESEKGVGAQPSVVGPHPGPLPWGEGGGGKAAWQLVGVFAVALLVINLGYGLRGSFTPLGEFWFQSQALSGVSDAAQHLGPGDNRFRGTALGRWPVPLPRDYVRGIDLQKHDFETGFVGYLAGEWRHGGWWYYYLYALAVKVPLGTLALFGLAVLGGTLARSASKEEDARPAEQVPTPSRIPVAGSRGLARDEWFSLARAAGWCEGPSTSAAPWRSLDFACLVGPPLAVLGLVSSQTGINLFLRYVLPALPFLAVVAGAALAPWRPRWQRALAAGCIVWGAASSLAQYPHSISYFNELAGGPAQGHEHLLDGNIGWGQDLLYLKRWVDEHPEARPLGLVYFGNLDARAAGLEFFLPPWGPVSPNRRCPFADEQQGPLPGWYAVDVSFVYGLNRQVLDERGDWQAPPPSCDFSYFSRLEPVARVGGSILIYRVTPAEAERVRGELGLAGAR